MSKNVKILERFEAYAEKQKRCGRYRQGIEDSIEIMKKGNIAFLEIKARDQKKQQRINK